MGGARSSWPRRVFPITEDGSPRQGLNSRDEIRASLRSSVKALGDLGFGTELQREILRRIIDGRRTITELVELIYGTSRDDQGFKADFMKVSRAIRRLESRGPHRHASLCPKRASSW